MGATRAALGLDEDDRALDEAVRARDESARGLDEDARALDEGGARVRELGFSRGRRVRLLFTGVPPALDRITKLTVSNLRCLESVEIELGPLNVGIGGNGSGKSSVVEACWLLRRSVAEGFVSELYSEHVGAVGLFRRGARSVSLGVRCEGDAGHPLDYELEIRDMGSGGLAVSRERVSLHNGKGPSPFRVLDRDANVARVFDTKTGKSDQFEVAPNTTVIAGFRGRPHEQPAFPRLVNALTSIEVHLPLSTVPRWASRLLRAEPSMRDSVLLQPAGRLGFGAENLANCYFALRNDKSEQHWQTTMDYVRLGLGADIESVNTRVDPAGGRVALSLKRFGVEVQESAFALSEGMLTYLAYVALLRLEAPTSLLVLDELETHLHPRLINRLVAFLDTISERTTVLAFTHSDRLLDALPDPARSVLLLELTESHATQVRRPNEEALKTWLDVYAGLGDARAAGHQKSVFGAGL